MKRILSINSELVPWIVVGVSLMMTLGAFAVYSFFTTLPTPTPPPTGGISNDRMATVESQVRATVTAQAATAQAAATLSPVLGEVGTESVVVVAHRGETIQNVVTVTSVNAIGWGVYGNPCPSLPGVEFLPSSGGISPGGSSTVWIQIQDSTTPGHCEGDLVVSFLSRDDQTERYTVKFQLTVLP